MESLPVEVWSDFLCPWCWSAALRLERVGAEMGPALRLRFRSFLLRPEPRGEAGPEVRERFRRYTEGWLRVGADEPRARFRPWRGDAGPPSHSVPAHAVAHAARRLGADAERRLRARLFEAYFSEGRDTSDPVTLRTLWHEAGLPEDGFVEPGDPGLVDAVRADHRAALELDVSGVPAVRIAGEDFVITGAQPEETYRRWFRRRLAARA